MDEIEALEIALTNINKITGARAELAEMFIAGERVVIVVLSGIEILENGNGPKLVSKNP